MEWLILFAVSWILFFLLIDWKRLRVNVWCGLTAVVMQLMVDTQAMSHGYYAVRKILLFSIFGTPVLFAFGPVFVIGTLLAQYHPRSRKMRIANVLVLMSLYSLQEFFLLLRKNVIYIDWHYFDSLLVNVGAIMILSWFAMTVLESRGSRLQ